MVWGCRVSVWEFSEEKYAGEEVLEFGDCTRFIWRVLAVLMVRVWISWRLESEVAGSSDRVKSRDAGFWVV